MRTCQFPTSSMIEQAAHDDKMKALWVWFRPTGKYVYEDVPGTVFDNLCKSSSAGAFFNAHIKDRYVCRRDPERRRFGPNADGRGNGSLG